MKTIVMTGATAGLGEVAAGRFRRAPDVRLIFGARGPAGAVGDRLALDLARLSAVRAFVQAVTERLGEDRIDSLVLNAGAQFPNADHRTEDGVETTFAVNHLAHYLILRLLMGQLAEGAAVVITTSDTHDPALNPAGPREAIEADAEALAHPSPAWGARRRPLLGGFRAYSRSKLCNLLTARGLAASPAARSRALTVIAYNPGFTPGTSLARAWPGPVRWLVGAAGVLSPVAGINTLAQAGDALADLGLGRTAPPPGRIYASLVRGRLTWPEPSELARRDDLMTALWRDSARMVGLPDGA